jgi:hypothetical protein
VDDVLAATEYLAPRPFVDPAAGITPSDPELGSSGR